MDTPKIEVTSKKWSLNGKDFLRGLLTAGLAAAAYPVTEAFVNSILTYLQANDPAIVPIFAAASSAFVGYVAKNFGTGASQKTPLTDKEVDILKNNVPTETAAK